MKMHKPGLWTFFFFLLIVSATFGFTRHTPPQQSDAQRPLLAAADTAPASAPDNAITTKAGFYNTIATVARENLPAVVHIDVTEQREVNNPLQPFENNPFFHYFFNTPRHMPRKFKRELRALGSGMIMDAQGHVLTNNHVVAGATTIKVVLADGSSYPGKVVGTDPKTDLAVVKIDAGRPLPHVTFGDSDQIQVGDWVVAIGAPRGLDQSVTQGIISAKHRRGILNPVSYEDYLQTDAAINPGNSGGPLLNLDGQVVGVNSAIESESGGFEGIGFAIPSNMAVHIAHQLIAHGKVERGWLGVTVQDVTPALAKAKSLTVTKGALVTDVLKGSPADQAGLRKDDVVTAYQGQAINGAAGLQNLVADSAIGEKATLTVVRDGKTKELTVKIGNLQTALKQLAASAEERLGATVRPVTAAEAQKYGIPQGVGVAVASLQKEGPMAQAGFEVGDIVTAVNNLPVNGVAEFADLVKLLPANKNVVLTAIDHRSGQTGYVQLRTR